MHFPCFALQATTLLSYRFVQFKRIGHHYYLLDLCYVVNALLCIYCGLALAGWGHLPVVMRLFQALFAMTNGPLAWAIPLFNNKLKFHSAQHIISLFIHISPACTTYAIRWYLDRATFPLAAEVADPQVSSLTPAAQRPQIHAHKHRRASFRFLAAWRELLFGRK